MLMLNKETLSKLHTVLHTLKLIMLKLLITIRSRTSEKMMTQILNTKFAWHVV